MHNNLKHKCFVLGLRAGKLGKAISPKNVEISPLQYYVTIEASDRESLLSTGKVANVITVPV